MTNVKILSTIFVISLFLTNFCLGESQNADKVHVDVYYESRCPDSKNFMQQLKKVYPNIKDKVELHYVPFGKAYSYDFYGETKFTCQHGARECEDNLYHSCVLDLIGKNQDVQTDFVTCAMGYSKNLQTCAQQAKVDLKMVEVCVKGARGLELQLGAEKESEDIIDASRFVPTIVYNKIYNSADFWSSLNNFETVVKKFMK